MAGSLVTYYSVRNAPGPGGAAPQESTSRSQETTEASTSCGTTSYSQGNASDYAYLFGSFTSMTVDYNTSGLASNLKQTGGLRSDFNYTYEVVSTTQTGFVINVSERGMWGGEPRPEGSPYYSQEYTARTTRNGSLLALQSGETNFTCFDGASTFASLMSNFDLATDLGGQLAAYTQPDYFHVVSRGSVVLGSTLTVANYLANTMPITYSYGGTTFSLSRYSLQVGTIVGSKIELVTLANLNGTQTNLEGTSHQDFTMRLVSVTRT